MPLSYTWPHGQSGTGAFFGQSLLSFIFPLFPMGLDELGAHLQKDR